MAHLPLNAAIFSPSVARAAASAARDWNFVDGWLTSRLRRANAQTGSAPIFERNPDTLRALLALVALNESADEERDLLASAEASALAELEAWEAERAAAGAVVRSETNRNRSRPESDHDSDDSDDEDHGQLGLINIRTNIIEATEAILSREGKAALDAVAGAAVELGVATGIGEGRGIAEAVGRRILQLQWRAFGAEQARARVFALQHYAETETQCLRRQEELLRGDKGRNTAGGEDGIDDDADGEGKVSSHSGYGPSVDQAKSNLDAQRALKTAVARLPELEERVAALATSFDLPSPSIEQVQEEEETYLNLLSRRKELDARIRSFHGLPADPDAARRELEILRDELRRLTIERDTVFEGLVERETPRNPRR
ncbi:hypothetical protein VTK73DRAFT_5435 [Phialemonium thermophilum]|uniref:Uncharacterized protein n=1 Tax=Phialemonium thermophilum TaxID=223376 RepID=A0ABR3WP66_9PEZI